MGRAFGNNIINLQAYKPVKDALDELGYTLEDFTGSDLQRLISLDIY